MIYAGTILLNLLAAFVDDKFPVIGALQQTNMTAEILDGAVKVNVENVNEIANVSETKIRRKLARALWRNVISSREIITHITNIFSLLISPGQRRNDIFMEHAIHCEEHWRYIRMDYRLIHQHRPTLQYPRRYEQVSRDTLESWRSQVGRKGAAAGGNVNIV